MQAWKPNSSVATALTSRFRTELLVNTAGINIGAVINNADFRSDIVIFDILRGGNSLVRVAEADAERIVKLNAFNGSGRGYASDRLYVRLERRKIRCLYQGLQ